jgi:2',3'-cyclic-nucleotide 2'-phosphodiesterase (5'-nucleotidase family)
VALLVVFLWSIPSLARHPAASIILSIVGTNDLHGSFLPVNGQGGLALLGAYVSNLRAVRAAEGGGVVLLDAGDTFQGGIESNLSEGAVVVDAFNALGYTAAAIGNHEFDFGEVDRPGRDLRPLSREGADEAFGHGRNDPRGALKARAAQARYPFLAANLLDDATGRLVDWPNVKPSVLVETAGVKVGIVGVMTIVAMRSTLAANVSGLSVAPLAPAIAAEAAKLRARGATVVLVTAHAGGRCNRFDDPADLSSCEAASEIFEVARTLPRGLVDAIVAGHSHAVVAHRVAGIPIIESFSHGRAFGRVDLVVDRETRRVVDSHLFQPQELCSHADPAAGGCAASGKQARYEGRDVVIDEAIVEAMAPAMRRVRARQAGPLDVVVDTDVRRSLELGSPLGNLFADAIRDAVPGTDISVNNNGFGGLRADLPQGLLTFGRLYDVFPFDNRLVRLTLSGAELQRVFTEEVQRDRRGALAISGVRVRAACDSDGLEVQLVRASGVPIEAMDRLTVVTTDMLATGAVFASVAPPAGFRVLQTAPIVREVVAGWLRRRGHIREDQFVDSDHRRWDYDDRLLSTCKVH